MDDDGLFWRAETTVEGAANLLALSNAGEPSEVAGLPGALRSLFIETPFTIWVGREYSRVIYVAWPAGYRVEGSLQAVAVRFEASESTPAPDYFPVPPGMKAWRFWWD